MQLSRVSICTANPFFFSNTNCHPLFPFYLNVSLDKKFLSNRAQVATIVERCNDDRIYRTMWPMYVYIRVQLINPLYLIKEKFLKLITAKNRLAGNFQND